MLLPRRRFLQRGALLVAAGLSVPTFLAETARALEARPAGPLASDRPTSLRRSIRASSDPGRRILVVVQLAGGNDGLNTLVPYANPDYYAARPTLAVPSDQVLPLDDEVGLHPLLPKLKARFESGQLAIVQGVGYPNPSRSHFRSMDVWQTAVAEQSEPTGWLGRYLEACSCGLDNHLEALVMGPTVQRSFWTELTLVPAISNLAAFQYGGPRANPAARAYEVAALRSALAQARGRPEEEFLRAATLVALDDADALSEVASGQQSPIEYPQSYFGQSLKSIAQIIAGQVGTRVFFATLGGFDTHANQAGQHQRLLADLDESLDAFARDLERLGRLEDVLLMTFSEFGRRVAQNASGGTDHGTAEPMLLLGGSVRGGLHGSYPSLSALERGDLRYTTDFRSVYGTVLADWLGGPAEQVLGGVFPSLDLV